MRIIRGKYGRRRFDVPKNITARPTTDFARENIFNVIENLIDIDGIEALDLFAGTGAISLELLSRGAARVTAVEKAMTQYAFIRRTAEQLGEQNLNLIKGDVFKFLAAPHEKFDFIFADPPYDLPRFGEIPQLVLQADILKPDGFFIIEHSRAYDFSTIPGFVDHRIYGSVNFSIIRK
ncbi:MAG: 16S rRNA (guanine(966)-N(2))-methyltransferase RsmD [Candidatus Limisoma sp.]|nr:16S rRNA (guanine(966)-N(2))-methyltransferase RsmD [Bacteroidales bacterium]MDD7760801.1 16S rRNA (guanine(966)-N(2))-methyltransferase RsmD [Bacteroidales bacterium]MDY5893541.1 16S rRNA (guanine(966)-N(2))-methyltransferase RsmD [Candidatus Limisoma sp.]MDY5999129.1 16S rRNA (guanine(966)-N(2))-methyltransferase RsmD [Candidatus Limisoma sp.]